MTASADISVNGERLVALGAGALLWPAQSTLIVADLHFEKGSHFAEKGVFLPPYDTRSTMKRLAKIMKDYRPETVISLGDAFHDGGAEARMAGDDACVLEALVVSTKWIWILGNHDPAPPRRFAGGVERCLRFRRLLFRHEPELTPETGEIAGHLHPVARVRAESRLIRRRCFATDGERLVMPAFGAYAGGLNVLEEAIATLFRKSPTAWMIGATGIYPFCSEALVPDSLSPLLRTA